MSLLTDPEFIAFIARVQEKWQIPGLSVTIVDTSQSNSVHSRGFGSPTSGPVTADSIFPIASNSKFFTVVALATLVEQGRLAWNSKLADVVPGLQLRSKIHQDTLTVEDVLSHQSGYARHLEAEFHRNGRVADNLALVNNLEPVLPPRQQYIYSNCFFGLLGHVIAVLSGMTYTDYVQKTIFDPLGMHSSSFSQPIDQARLVTPYVSIPVNQTTHEIGPSFQHIPEDNLTLPSAGILSTGLDMGKWMAYLSKLYRDELLPSDPRIIASSTLQYILQPRILASEQIGGIPVNVGKGLFPEFEPASYALAQLKAVYRDIEYSSHNGMAPGGGCLTLWIPDGEFGVVVLTNVMTSAFHAACVIALEAVDRHYKFGTTDWISRLAGLPVCKNGAVGLPPSQVGSLPDLPLPLQVHNAAAGYLNIIRPGTLASEILSPRSKYIIGLLEKAHTFGAVCDRLPDLLAFFENDTLFSTYVALFHVDGDIFLGFKHNLYQLADGSVDVPMAVSWHSAAGRIRLDVSAEKVRWYEDFVADPEANKVGCLEFV